MKAVVGVVACLLVACTYNHPEPPGTDPRETRGSDLDWDFDLGDRLARTAETNAARRVAVGDAPLLAKYKRAWHSTTDRIRYSGGSTIPLREYAFCV